jgi:quinol monooxygenase YgiN
MPSSCLLEIECRILLEKRREFRLNVAVSAKRTAASCGPAAIYEDQNEPGHILFVEEWRSLAELQAFLESDSFLSLVGAFEVLGSVSDCRVVELSAEGEAGGRHAGQARALRGWRKEPAGGAPEAS